MQLSRASIVMLALAAIALIAYTAQPASADDTSSANRINRLQEAGGNGCTDSIEVSPVLMMNTAGFTLLGPQMSSMTVYSNGLVILSEASGPTGASAAAQNWISTEHVQTLARDLRELGAFQACDQTQHVSDVPLTTVTVFDGEQDARAHTYSYWIADDQQRLVEQAAQDFLINFVLVE